MPRAKRPNPANNRTDLLTPDAPGRKMAVPGQEQGKRTAQEQSQSILPIGTPPPPRTPEQVNAPTAAPGPGLPSVGAPSQQPRQVGNWLGPTTRPSEPLTAGLPFGPGPGPEALRGLGQIAATPNNENASLQSLLTGLAQRPGSASVLKVLASRSGATVV